MPNENGGASSNQNSTMSESMMKSIAECMTLQQSLLNIPYFDGKNLPLKDFLQDVKNGAAFVLPEAEQNYVRGVLARLRGSARDSTYGKTFNTTDELIKHLKERFAPCKTFPYYQYEIERIRMNRGESVNDFYDRLNLLMNGAKIALEDKYGNQTAEMMKPVAECALESFIRGLTDELARAVDIRDPQDLDQALKIAVKAENKMKSGMIPGGEPPRVTFSHDNSHRDYSNDDRRNRHYRTFNIASSPENSRTPSPLPSTSSAHPAGILKRSDNDSSNHYFTPNAPYPMPYPPPVPYPYYPYFPPQLLNQYAPYPHNPYQNFYTKNSYSHDNRKSKFQDNRYQTQDPSRSPSPSYHRFPNQNSYSPNRQFSSRESSRENSPGRLAPSNYLDKSITSNKIRDNSTFDKRSREYQNFPRSSEGSTSFDKNTRESSNRSETRHADAMTGQPQKFERLTVKFLETDQ